MSESNKRKNQIKGKFDTLFQKYNTPEYLGTDPIFLCYLYDSKEDKEFVGLISSLFAYGNVTAIRRFLSRLLEPMGKSPKSFLLSEGTKVLRNRLGAYRFQTENDTLLFLDGLRIAYRQNAQIGSWSLEPWFQTETSRASLENRILHFQRKFGSVLQSINPKWETYGLKFLIGTGKQNSALKRYCMFLRWMVRNQSPDFGLYKSISTSELVFPLDTHINRIGEIIGATFRKSPDFKKSREITDFFLDLYPEDPLRMDFALSRLGILKKCKAKYDQDLCETCELRSICRIYANR
ncbi:TIGR02757 family protein [Leptospira perolatii]|uniref:TIGR02757 family protein n=1 Tax=Leptospira perolatii TaxID=2023191 RepID=A0A2M9ZMH8_9LEPT|nr:TIGR02757 family protein [Leptospira perolatii]PJZ69113.1 TIGR02757 family protein [Leptospira perolatii]PJZ73143.1 TIGR02757 family protein [Leptospira perolatii]